MALRAVPEHPKFAALKASLSLTKFQTLGLLEALWHFTGKFAPRGNVGKYSDLQIEAWLEWTGEQGKAVRGLVEAGWLDENPVHRLIVHDWHAHADATTKKWLGRTKEGFVSDMSGHNGKVSGPPEPAPEPVPEPVTSPSGLPVFAVPISVKFDHSMVSAGVQMELCVSGERLSRNISEVAKAEIKAGADGLELMMRMVESGRQYLKAKADGKLEFPPGLERFYGESLWRDNKLWPWKNGQKPARAGPDPLEEQRREREQALKEKQRLESNA